MFSKLFTVLLAVQVAPISAAAQHSSPQPTTGYVEYYDQLMALAANPNRIARIDSAITLQRGAGQISFSSGTFYELGQISQRTVAIAFLGTGIFTFSPADGVERGQLYRFFDEAPLEREFESVVMVFADTTAQELDALVDFLPGNIATQVGGRIRRTLEYLGDEDTRDFNPDLLRSLINGVSNEMFYAHLDMKRGPDLMFSVDPWSVERSILTRSVGNGRSEVISQVSGTEVGAPPTGDRTGEMAVVQYDIDVSLPRTSAGNLSFIGMAHMRIAARVAVGPWIPLVLHPTLVIDSAFGADGRPAITYKGEEGSYLWINAGERMGGGDTTEFKLFYHGDFIDRYGNFFFIKSSIAWYPQTLARSKATFNVTYHTPVSYEFASAGILVESSEDESTLTTHWRSREPMRNMGFNLGLFEVYEANEGEGPPVTVLYADAVHRELRGTVPHGRNMKQQVGADVTNALRFFGRVFGSSGLDRFYATEIPYSHGEAFPGLIHLAVSTFTNTSSDGFDEFFRAHEVAHQWWGIGMDFSSYHDQWLSEGFATFAGLWYVQTVRRDNGRYFGLLRDWRNAIVDTRGSPDDLEDGGAPIALDYRGVVGGVPNAYNIVVYNKGAWVVHMLRIMMLDLQTMNEDPFTNMMQDFYEAHRGGYASTADFQRTVEEHIGMPMDWFFDQWYRGTYIPKFRVSWTSEPVGNGNYRLRLRVKQEHVPPDFRSFVTVAVNFGVTQARLRVEVTGSDSEIPMPLMPFEPVEVKFNELESVLAEVDYERWQD